MFCAMETLDRQVVPTYLVVGCWIIGDALDRGVGKIAGEAVAEYVEAYGGDKMLAIGVTPMQSLKLKHIFNTNASVSCPVLKLINVSLLIAEDNL